MIGTLQAENQTSVTNPLGFISTSVYSANSNRKSASIDPLGNRTTYSYDFAGQQASRRDALGNRITYSYDLAGQMMASVDPQRPPHPLRPRKRGAGSPPRCLC